MFHIVDFSGLNKLHLITKGKLFLCDSGDEIVWGEERCDLRNDCYDFSDEKNCTDRKLYRKTHRSKNLWNCVVIKEGFTFTQKIMLQQA